jgi:serine/threonine protein kinase
MTLDPGRRLGPYEIQSHAGAGGMGEVYKARDTRLDRVVAIKVLPGHLASEAELRERFEREAQPEPPAHLRALRRRPAGRYRFPGHGIPGRETLASRIARGPQPVTERLPIGRQMADALEAAHDKGIVHRDQKPASVAITSDGNVKLLDFGLAKATAAAGVGEASSPPVNVIPNRQPGKP